MIEKLTIKSNDLVEKRDKFFRNFFERFKIKIDSYHKKIKNLEFKLKNLPIKQARNVEIEDTTEKEIIEEYLIKKEEAILTINNFIEQKKLEYQTNYKNILEKET